MFFKIGVLQNLANFIEKRLCWNLFLNKRHLLDFLLKKQQFIKKGTQRKEQLFYETLPVAASEKRITEETEIPTVCMTKVMGLQRKNWKKNA